MVKFLGLSPRQQTILRATVQHYIATAEPVGSQTLAQEYPLAVSSATIRNALGQLEKAGLLYQPHVSAGRIPSDSGYRTYVDSLLTWSEQQTQAAKHLLTQQLQGEQWAFEARLQRLGHILASLSGYISLITFPQSERVRLRHLQLLSLSPKEVLMILVTDGYQTHSFKVDLPKAVWEKAEDDLQQDLETLTNFLNHHLQGKSLLELSQFNWQELDRRFVEYEDFLATIQKNIRPYCSQRSAAPMLVHGVAEMIRQPEFSQLEQIQTLLFLLEQEQEQLANILLDPDETSIASSNFSSQELFQSYRSPSVTLRIGSENPLTSMHLCTLISCSYAQGYEQMGTVSILGPTRMLYKRVIPLVEQAAEYLSQALSHSP